MWYPDPLRIDHSVAASFPAGNQGVDIKTTLTVLPAAERPLGKDATQQAGAERSAAGFLMRPDPKKLQQKSRCDAAAAMLGSGRIAAKFSRASSSP